MTLQDLTYSLSAHHSPPPSPSSSPLNVKGLRNRICSLATEDCTCHFLCSPLSPGQWQAPKGGDQYSLLLLLLLLLMKGCPAEEEAADRRSGKESVKKTKAPINWIHFSSFSARSLSPSLSPMPAVWRAVKYFGDRNVRHAPPFRNFYRNVHHVQSGRQLNLPFLL